MSRTSHYNLYVDDDSSTSFYDWRMNMAGETVSNMTKIDNALYGKIDINQGIENVGKFFTVGSDGNMTLTSLILFNGEVE